MLVYLAGGMRSGWQDTLQFDEPLRREGVRFLDPRMHQFEAEGAYTAWDLEAVKQADLIFAFLEADNPSGYGMSLEIGYAKALGKMIIFVEEPGHPQSRYLGMCRASATFNVDDLKTGIMLLLQLAESGLYRS